MPRATVNGLQEYDFVVANTSPYVVEGTLELVTPLIPTAAQGPGGGGIATGSTPALPIPSQVVTVVKQNSSTVYTGPAGARGFRTSIQATAGDTVKIIFSSSLAQDQAPGAVKCTVSIYEGLE